MSLQNLPGSQLRAPAEIQQDSSDEREDDNVPLVQFSKRRRIDSDPESFSMGSLPPDPETNCSTPAQALMKP